MIPGWVRVVTVAAVSVVAAVAAVVSYVHLHELAERAGEAWRAHLIPLSVDGMLVAASMVMLVRRRTGQRAGLLPWAGLVLGLTASLAANIAAARPEPLSWVVSGWPAVALAVSFELLILVARDTNRAAQAGSEAPVLPVDEIIDEPEGDGLRDWWAEDGPAVESPTSDDRAAELIAQGVGRRKLAKELGVSEHQARALLRELRVNGVPQ